MTKVLAFCVIFLIHCGGSIQNTQDTSAGESSSGTTLAVFYSTDFSSPGELHAVSTHLADSSLQTLDNSALGSDATLAGDDAGRVAVIHSAFSAFSLNNVTVLDAVQNFNLLLQETTGDGTNPIAGAIVDDVIYLSLMNGENDPENADILVMSLDDGRIVDRISLTPFTQADDDRHAFPAEMIVDSESVFVLMQDLNSDFSVTAPGQIIRIDTENNSAESLGELAGRNPFSIALSSEESCFFIAHLAEFNDAFVNDTSTEFGGIEMVCEDGQVLVDDAYLGGYVEKVAVSDIEGKVFAVVSTVNENFTETSVIVSIPLAELLDGNTEPNFTTFFDPDADIRDLALDADDRLWVSTRVFTDTDTVGDASVVVLDSNDATVLKLFDTHLPVTSIAFVDL